MTLETISHLVYKGTLVHGIIFTIYSLIRRKLSVANKMGVLLLFLWVVPAWILRLVVAGHFPIFGAYESALSILFFTGFVLFILSRFRKEKIFIFYPILCALMLIHAIRFDHSVWALTISERSVFVHLHAFSAYIAFGFMVAIFTNSVMILFKKEGYNLKNLLSLFFLFYSLTMILGSLYRFLLFGKSWSFDPMETMNLCSFLAFSALLHFAEIRKGDEKSVAIYAIVCSLLLVLSYRLILIFPPFSSYHIIDISLRMHILPK